MTQTNLLARIGPFFILWAMPLSVVALDWYTSFAHPWIWWLVGYGCVIVGTQELIGMFQLGGHALSTPAVHVAALTILTSTLAVFLPESVAPVEPLPRLGLLMGGCTVAVTGLLLVELARFDQPGASSARLGLSVVAATFVSVPLSLLGFLRLWPDGGPTAPGWGLLAVCSTALLPKLADSGAFLIGKFFGRIPLSPKLSPQKTVEGAVAGFVAAGGASLAIYAAVPGWLIGPKAAEQAGPWWGWFAYGLLIALAAMLGDLGISLFKRDVEVKDTANWIPAFGGVLDVLDSILAATPVAFICWWVGLIGP